jgi:hypothetical protein
VSAAEGSLAMQVGCTKLAAAAARGELQQQEVQGVRGSQLAAH